MAGWLEGERYSARRRFQQPLRRHCEEAIPALCATHGVGTIRRKVQTDFCDPRIDDSCVLPGRQVVRAVDTAWKEIGVGLKLRLIDPIGDCISRRLSDLELDWALRLLLKDNGARGDVIRRTDIAHMQLDQVTCPELAVDR